MHPVWSRLLQWAWKTFKSVQMPKQKPQSLAKPNSTYGVCFSRRSTYLTHSQFQEIRTKLATLSQRHVLSTSLRSQKLSNNHILLFQRVVRLSQHLHLLIPLVRSSALRPEEEQLRARLEATEDELRRGNASKGRMNEMWGVVGQLTALKAREGMETGGEGKEWAVVDEEGLRRLSRVRVPSPTGMSC